MRFLPRDVALSATFRSRFMLREYKDQKGVHWRVWDVYPEARTSGPNRITGSVLQTFPHKDLSEGWLCFESANEKRRVAPIPPGWEFLTPAAMEELCMSAGYVSRSGGSEDPERPQSRDALESR